MQQKKKSNSEQIVQRWLIIGGVLLAVVLLNMSASGELPQILVLFKNPRVQVFTIVLVAILLEGLTFLLLGSCLSGIIEVFVPQEFLEKRFPRSRIPAALTGSVMGLCFPVCSCGNIPLTRRLMKKGVPVAGAISYLLAAPLINPITIISTILAFPASKVISLERTGMAFLIASICGIMFSRYDRSLIMQDASSEKDSCHHHDSSSKISRILHHAEDDFFLTGRYFVLGAITASLFQTCIPRTVLGSLSQNSILSILLLGGLGMLFSLCSFADAFVASTFTTFPAAAKLVFMTAGPMIGITLIFLYLGTFRRKFAGRLIFTVAGILFLFALIRSFLGG